MEGLVDNVGAYTLSMARECRNLAILAFFSRNSNVGWRSFDPGAING